MLHLNKLHGCTYFALQTTNTHMTLAILLNVQTLFRRRAIGKQIIHHFVVDFKVWAANGDGMIGSISYFTENSSNCSRNYATELVIVSATSLQPSDAVNLSLSHAIVNVFPAPVWPYTRIVAAKWNMWTQRRTIISLKERVHNWTGTKIKHCILWSIVENVVEFEARNVRHLKVNKITSTVLVGYLHILPLDPSWHKHQYSTTIRCQ